MLEEDAVTKDKIIQLILEATIYNDFGDVLISRDRAEQIYEAIKHLLKVKE